MKDVRIFDKYRAMTNDELMEEFRKLTDEDYNHVIVSELIDYRSETLSYDQTYEVRERWYSRRDLDHDFLYLLTERLDYIDATEYSALFYEAKQALEELLKYRIDENREDEDVQDEIQEIIDNTDNEAVKVLAKRLQISAADYFDYLEYCSSPLDDED